MSMTHDASKLPGVFFIYDLSPIKVVFKESSRGWTNFLIKVFGTAGGLFTLSMLLDRFLLSGSRTLRTIKKKS